MWRSVTCRSQLPLSPAPAIRTINLRAGRRLSAHAVDFFARKAINRTDRHAAKYAVQGSGKAARIP